MVILAGDNSGKYHYCPVVDNGSALLSDLTVDYPLSTGYPASAEADVSVFVSGLKTANPRQPFG